MNRPMPCVLDAWLAAQLPPLPEGTLAQRVRCAQDAALRATLEKVREHSRFYGRSLARMPQVRGVADLSALPFTTAADLEHWQDFLCVSQGEVARMVTLHTSGTTGAPKRLAFSRRDLARTMGFFGAGMEQLVGAGQCLLVLLPGAERPNGVADLLRQALPQVRVTAGQPEATAHSLRENWRRFAPHAVVGAPGQLARLCAMGAAENLSGAENLAQGGILSSAEPLSPELAQRLTETFQCSVLDHYGLTETCYGGGVQCLRREGYHWRHLDALLEIVEPCAGRSLPPGHVGEVVITTLNREAMPLVRYRTGDAASLFVAPCACGSPLPRLGPVLGRIVRRGGGWEIRDLPKGAVHAGTC